ncbi:glycoside hydrolase family 31 protein [Lactobacillus sp. ESL0679]|uniref:TIM-barrel domain-containing protein n=1 Tax=Lactobacillus sp. ESL0679 TaxID=2983209 RepID=UPI0023F7D5C7|nr:TIM-barrel domain-containing protein [Lactobacillus sp. ESL0679]MDF7683551.1 glycoside hydrolase family 31 protein [Lactobacillus sp. ESL0679]
MVINILKQDNFYEVSYASGMVARVYLLAANIFRYYVDPTGQYAPPKQSQAGLHAQILAPAVDEYGSHSVNSSVIETAANWAIVTDDMKINFAKDSGAMSVWVNDKLVLQEACPVSVSADGSTQFLQADDTANYFGGGTQNGRFNLSRQRIIVANTSNWLDQGVASPAPFYWSTAGYGVLRYTFTRGEYDFASENPGLITTKHEENRFDAIYFFAPTPYQLIHTYQELTGLPLLLPIFGFYEAHLNAYNRDYWVKADPQEKGAIKYPDGNFYREYHPKELPEELKGQAIRETLNGEQGGAAYLLSARGMLDQYLANDMPLGWFLPNDGYGAGYGQTDSLQGNLQNLADFIRYANSRGVEVGLWTQQSLSPVDPAHPKVSDRDFEQELAAGVTALKTDMAWVGAGYSFGLDGTQTAAAMIKKIKGKNLRPFIITMDGWAGTHNTAAVWTGDQKGGQWEYIRFQIPTYIGEGLSGQPNVGSDMDGIYLGSNSVVNTRDYQWKAFTPIQLNMDGWGANPKNPFAFSEPITTINRAYLKQKTMLLPYIYTAAHEAVVAGKPLVRALFLEYPDLPECYSDLAKYEYLWGDAFLVAPIYQNTAADDKGNDIRNGIYLPDEKQIWFDYYTGKAYQGGQVINEFAAPIWKLPVFVKGGAIIAKAPATNTPKEYLQAKQARQFEIYPGKKNKITVYEDDGISAKYQDGAFAQTTIEAGQAADRLLIKIAPTVGHYEGMKTQRTTELAIKMNKLPNGIAIKLDDQKCDLKQAESLTEFVQDSNVYYFDKHYLPNPYLAAVGNNLEQTFLRIKLAAVDVSQIKIELQLTGVDTTVTPENCLPKKQVAAKAPIDLSSSSVQTTTLSWQYADESLGRVTYNVKVDGVLYTGIKEPKLVVHGLLPNKQHAFKVQIVTDKGTTAWSKEQLF